MAATYSSEGLAINFEAIETLVKQSKTVISAEDSAIIELALRAAEEGKTATFYLKDDLFTEIIKRRYRTHGCAKTVDLQPLSPDEIARIKADFDVELDGYSSKEICPRCGSVYGTYEFIQQGIKEHGKEVVKAVFSLKSASVLQIHPRQNIICQSCGLDLAIFFARVHDPHSYLYRSQNHSYGCCR